MTGAVVIVALEEKGECIEKRAVWVSADPRWVIPGRRW